MFTRARPSETLIFIHVWKGSNSRVIAERGPTAWKIVIAVLKEQFHFKMSFKNRPEMPEAPATILFM